MKLSQGLVGIIGAGLLSGCATLHDSTSDTFSKYLQLMETYDEETVGERVVGDLYIDLSIDRSVSVTKTNDQTEYFTLTTKLDLLDENDPFKLLAVSYIDSGNNGFTRKDTVYLAVEVEPEFGIESYVFLDEEADGTVDGVFLSDKPLLAYIDSFDTLEFGGSVDEMDSLYHDAVNLFVND